MIIVRTINRELIKWLKKSNTAIKSLGLATVALGIIALINDKELYKLRNEMERVKIKLVELEQNDKGE